MILCLERAVSLFPSSAEKGSPFGEPFSADDGIRTRDLVITNDVRYRLRYISVNGHIIAKARAVVNTHFSIFQPFFPGPLRLVENGPFLW